MVFTLRPAAHLGSLPTGHSFGKISCSSGIVRSVQGGVVKTFRCATYRTLTFPLQHLIVTPGWAVGYHQFHAVDPTPALVADNLALWFKQDMYQAHHQRYDRLIDLGWTPEGDWDDGAFKLVLYAGDFRGQLLREIRTKGRQQVVTAMNDWLDAVSNGQL